MLQHIDTTVFLALNRGVACGPLDWLMPRLTGLHHQGWFVALVGIVCLIALWKGDRRARVWVLCALLAVGLGDGVAYRAIKRFAPRTRPCQSVTVGGSLAVPEVRLVRGESCPGSPSFPSNHATNMMALGTVCWWFTRGRKRWLWFLLPLVIGYTRIYLGYHYPSDVLGGWVLGAAMASAVLATVGRLARPHSEA